MSNQTSEYVQTLLRAQYEAIVQTRQLALAAIETAIATKEKVDFTTLDDIDKRILTLEQRLK